MPPESIVFCFWRHSPEKLIISIAHRCYLRSEALNSFITFLKSEGDIYISLLCPAASSVRTFAPCRTKPCVCSSVIILLEPAIECRLADLQDLRGFGSVPVGPFQDPLYMVPFNFGQGTIWGSQLLLRLNGPADFRGNMFW